MKKRSDLLLLLPSLCGFTTFYIVPFLYSLYYAFTENAFSDKFVGLGNFKMLLENEYFRLAAWNTFRFSVLAVPVCMLFSFTVAMLIARFAAKSGILRSAFFLPIVLPSAVIAGIWNAYFAEAVPFASLLALFLWKYSGLNITLILTALLTIPHEQYEAASLDGAGAWQKTWSVTLPNILPSLFFTLILTIVNSLKIFRESYLLYGYYPDESVYMLQNYLNNHFAKLNYQNIGAAAVLFAVVVYSIVAVLFALEKKWSDSIW